jgi:hypothetical protein
MRAYAGLGERALRLISSAFRGYVTIACLGNSTWQFGMLKERQSEHSVLKSDWFSSGCPKLRNAEMQM